jgi:hypothetical protein
MPSSTVTGRFLISCVLEAGSWICAPSANVAICKNAATNGHTGQSQDEKYGPASLLFSVTDMDLEIICMQLFCDLMLTGRWVFNSETDGPVSSVVVLGQNISLNANCIERGPPV